MTTIKFYLYFPLKLSYYYYYFYSTSYTLGASLVAQMVKASACSAGDLDLIPGSGRSPGEGNGNPLQYSCLENSMNGGAWWAIVHGVSKNQTRLSYFTFFLSFLGTKSNFF